MSDRGLARLGPGRAFVYGDEVTTDDILPGRFLDRANDQVKSFALAGIDPEFVGAVSPGDFIVAGERFGVGSGRESAPYAIKGAGVAAVIARSFGRLFFRNAINIGLPAVVAQRLEGVSSGDLLVVDLAQRTVFNRNTGATTAVANLTGISMEILEAGGIIPYSLARQSNGRGS